jgi:hypothetical protein
MTNGKSIKLWTFATSSRGGIGALGQISKAYGKEMRQRPGEFPVVALGSSSYQHPNRSYGRIKVPTFEFTGSWVEAKLYLELVGESGKDAATATAVATTDLQKNVFQVYGEMATSSRIIGELLKFAKGDFLAGMDAVEVPIGTQVVPIMDTLSVGWTKWEDMRPVEQQYGLVIEGYQPPRRKDLGDLDENEWERDDDGKPRDPWQLGNQLVLAEYKPEKKEAAPKQPPKAA